MKEVILTIFVIIFSLCLIAVGFTVSQVRQDEQSMKVDLQSNVKSVSLILKSILEKTPIQKTNTALQEEVEQVVNAENISGIAVYSDQSILEVTSSNFPKELTTVKPFIDKIVQENTSQEEYVRINNKLYYLMGVPLNGLAGSKEVELLVQDASYIEQRVSEIWRSNTIRLLIQMVMLTVTLGVSAYWFIYKPLSSIALNLESERRGISNGNDYLAEPVPPFYEPLAKEISNLKRNLMEARLAASEEARLSLEKMDAPWTPERLKEFIKDTLDGRSLFVVSNREPYIHTKENGKITSYTPASGMVTAIEPLMKASGATWIAEGTGDADKLVVDKNDKIQVPPEEPQYSLKRVWLTPEEDDRYYYGFSNEGLWPLFHNAHTRPTFRKEDWEEYKRVNHKFANTVLSEIKNLQQPVIFIQDYHFALLPRMIKKARPDATIGLFWHIPWVSAEAFSICPWKKDILHGILGADLVGFHTQLHCNNFIESAGRELESLINYEQFTITHEDHLSLIKAFPISIPFSDNHGSKMSQELLNSEKDALRKEHNIQVPYVALGVDRLDYTKGILERLKAVEIFLRLYPHYQEKFVFLQIAAPSRTKIKKYHDFGRDVEEEVKRINQMYARKNWKPIIFLNHHQTHEKINSYYRLANVCLVTSLHDGMNLVAKEYVAARQDERGVLILSQFTGASRELKDALIINPYNAEQTAKAIQTSLTMSITEQEKRMKNMRTYIRGHNVYRWSADFIRTLVTFT